jgi:hypothetical protein
VLGATAGVRCLRVTTSDSTGRLGAGLGTNAGGPFTTFALTALLAATAFAGFAAAFAGFAAAFVALAVAFAGAFLTAAFAGAVLAETVLVDPEVFFPVFAGAVFAAFAGAFFAALTAFTGFDGFTVLVVFAALTDFAAFDGLTVLVAFAAARVVTLACAWARAVGCSLAPERPLEVRVAFAIREHPFLRTPAVIRVPPDRALDCSHASQICARSLPLERRNQSHRDHRDRQPGDVEALEPGLRPRKQHDPGRRNTERGAQQLDRCCVGAPVDRRRHHPDLECLAVTPHQLSTPGARLHVDVDDRTVAIGLDDAVETA